MLVKSHVREKEGESTVAFYWQERGQEKGDKQGGLTFPPPRSLKPRGGVMKRLNSVNENESQSAHNETALRAHPECC